MGNWKPLVSIIMPAYNSEKTIEESINSVIAQTCKNWELIVVNDCSTDNTKEIIKKLKSNEIRIRLFTSVRNNGVAKARNFALKKANGKYIAFLDSDDLWLPKKLEKQVSFMVRNNALISFTGTAYINNEGIPSSYIQKTPKHFYYHDLLKRNIMTCSSMVVQKNVMTLFPKGFLHEDYVVWLRILKKYGQAYGLDKPFTVYRLSKESKSANRFSSAFMIFNAYKHVGFNKLSSLLLTLRYAVFSTTKRLRIKYDFV